MATRKLVNPVTGKPQEAEVIDILSVEGNRPVIIQLGDGSTLRMMLDVIEVARFSNTWDPEGLPLYQVRSGSSMVVLDAPDSLKKQ